MRMIKSILKLEIKFLLLIFGFLVLSIGVSSCLKEEPTDSVAEYNQQRSELFASVSSQLPSGTCAGQGGDGTDCEEYYLGPVTFTIFGCEHKAISWRIKECNEGVTISELHWTRLPTEPCDSLEVVMDSIGSFFYDQVYIQLSLAVQEYTLNYIEDKGEDKYNCSNPQSQPCEAVGYNVAFVQSGCYFLCMKTRIVGGPGLSDGSGKGDGKGDPILGVVEIHELQCGTGCCKRSTPFCITEDGVCYGDPIKEAIGDCDPSVSYECDDLGSTKTSECTHPCNKL